MQEPGAVYEVMDSSGRKYNALWNGKEYIEVKSDPVAEQRKAYDTGLEKQMWETPFQLPRTESWNPLALAGNAAAQAVELPINAVIGAARGVSAAGSALKSLAEKPWSLPTARNYNLNDTFGPEVAQLLKEAVEQKANEYKPENIQKNPLTPVLDVLSVMDLVPRLASKLASSGPGLLKSALAKRYTKTPYPDELVNPTWGVTSTATDAQDVARRAGTSFTLGQSFNDPRALDIESYSRNLPSRLYEQNKALTSLANKEMTAIPGAVKGDMSTPTSVIASNVRDRAILNVNREQAALKAKVAAISKATGLNPTELESGIIQTAKGGIDAQTVVSSLNKQAGLDYMDYMQARQKLNEVTKTKVAEKILGSRDPLREYAGKVVREGVVPDVGDPDYIAAFKQVLTSDKTNDFVDFINIPGIGAENGLKALNHAALRRSFDEGTGTLNAAKFSSFLNQQSDKYALVTGGSAAGKNLRASLNSIAHALQTQARHTSPQNAALNLVKRGDGGMIMTAAALTPLAFGGNVLQGRAAMGTAKLALQFGEKELSALMLNPEANFIMSRLAKIPYSNPAALNSMKALARIAGKMNIPATFVDKDGNQMTIGPDQLSPQE